MRIVPLSGGVCSLTQPRLGLSDSWLKAWVFLWKTLEKFLICYLRQQWHYWFYRWFVFFFSVCALTWALIHKLFMPNFCESKLKTCVTQKERPFVLAVLHYLENPVNFLHWFYPDWN